MPLRPYRKPHQENHGLHVRHEDCWAKTTKDGRPGISVRDHCLNVGCVAEALLSRMLPSVKSLLPSTGMSTLAAMHDVGKVSPGFQAKCSDWLGRRGLDKERAAWPNNSESDHAKVSQYALQQQMTRDMPNLWAAVVGAHHGRLKGNRIAGITEANQVAWRDERERLACELQERFGQLPVGQPSEGVLWCVAGLLTVADWIGSDENYFPQTACWSVEERTKNAGRTVESIGLGPVSFRTSLGFAELFPSLNSRPNALQQAAIDRVRQRGLYVIEGPMGCGKTEAALAAAYNLVSQGLAGGIYFALPTQTTSNRIHRRVADFLSAAGALAHLRLAHSSSWLNEDQVLRIVPSSGDATDEERESAKTGLLWFSSSKRGLLSPFGVGTVDQALLGIVAAKHFFVRQFGLAGKVVILDEIHSYDLYTSTLIDALIRRLLELKCTVIVLSATLTRERRRQILGYADMADYPLLACRTDADGVVEIPAKVETANSVAVLFKDSAVLIEHALSRASRGECVLWIRNTVADAQQTYLGLRNENRQDGPELALIHARFPFFRRENLENEWMAKLGKDSKMRPTRGCVLVSTQVAEQSVDIDADLLITDLAPTDMIFQRIGRLWRHPRGKRSCDKPEVWIIQPKLSLESTRVASAKEIKAGFGKSAAVYAPYILVRSLEQWERLQRIQLPDDIRPILESTYAARDDEPDSWRDLKQELDEKTLRMAGKALNATQVWSNPPLEDEEGVQTRYGQVKTASLLIVTRRAECGDAVEMTLLDGKSARIPHFGFDFSAAKALHRNVIPIPRWCVLKALGQTPAWLKAHTSSCCVLGTLDECTPLGRIVTVDGNDQSKLYYRDDLGIVVSGKTVGPRGGVSMEEWEDESCD